jgi:hypothetical protein
MSLPQILQATRHVAHAIDVGCIRDDEAVLKKRVSKNGGPPSGSPAARRLSVRGALAESAAALWLPMLHWYDLEDEVSGLPDLGAMIDVRGVWKSSHRLILQYDNNPDWAYLKVGGYDHPRYTILGWQWGYVIKKPEWNWKHVKRPAYFYDGPLRHPDELLRMIMTEDRWHDVPRARRNAQRTGLARHSDQHRGQAVPAARAHEEVG